jgi:HlyD family secretion protein
MLKQRENHLETGISRLFIVGAIGIVLLIFCLGGWAFTTSIRGAVVASGQVDVTGKPKVVQSLDGGILSEISVRNGDRVAQGDVLARLDPTLLEINLDIARNRLATALSLRARLEAERNSLEILEFDYSDMPANVQVHTLETAHGEAGQRSIFNARAEMLKGGRDRLAGALKGLDNQVTGLEGQISAIEQQLTYIEKDLASAEDLSKKGLIRQDRMTELQRAQAVLLGELAARRADLARLDNTRSEMELKTIQEERSFHEKVVTNLREVTAEIEELVLEIVTRRAQLERVDIRAPSDGIVHELQFTTLGGVMKPGETLLNIVPQNSGFDFELRVDPRSINRVSEDQSAQIVLAAFDPQTTPKLEGRVRAISPEVIQDRKTGESFYRVSLEVPPSEFSRLPNNGAGLIAGMPVEAYLQTEYRTVLSYLVEPITTHMRRAFRE